MSEARQTSRVASWPQIVKGYPSEHNKIRKSAPLRNPMPRDNPRIALQHKQAHAASILCPAKSDKKVLQLSPLLSKIECPKVRCTAMNSALRQENCQSCAGTKKPSTGLLLWDPRGNSYYARHQYVCWNLVPWNVAGTTFQSPRSCSIYRDRSVRDHYNGPRAEGSCPHRIGDGAASNRVFVRCRCSGLGGCASMGTEGTAPPTVIKIKACLSL